MRAAVRDDYGLDELEIREVERPAVADDEVLVHVQATSVNPVDYYTVTGPLMVRPMNGFRKPKTRALGTDFAGTVEAVGKNVTRFQPGDDVYGGRTGAFGELVSVPEDRAIARKPANISFEEAGAAPIAAITALQGLRDKANVQAGQKVLINGASGGVGTYGAQIAKALGADVTAVCSTRNVEQARSLGADRVIDYTREDFTKSGERYDVIFDVAGNRSLSACKQVLSSNATFVVVGAPKSHPLRHVVKMLVAGKLRRNPKVIFFVAKLNQQDLNALTELFESGKLKSVIERRYELHDIGNALRYLREGHARGKIVVTV